MGLQGTSIPVAGGYVTTVYCPNSYAWQRLLDAIATINPEAGAPAPVPHDLAAAMLRDGVVAAPEVTPLAAIEGYNPPPNCSGNHGHDSYHAHDAPMPPHLAERLDGKDDDEGESVPGYPPGVSCNVTGECEE